MSDFDVIVIGAGPGGYVAAIRAAQLGGKVAVVERGPLGGVCLNVGCIPTKTLVHAAETFHGLHELATLGLAAEAPSYNLARMRERKNKVVGLNTGGVANLFKSLGIQHISGEASVPRAGAVEVNGEALGARAIIVATGGRPASLPGLALNGRTVIGSTEALEIETLPPRIAVIGAGPLGAEFASAWNLLGAKVALVEALDTVLPREDADLTKRLGASFRKRGIDLRTGTKVARLEETAAGITLTLEGAQAGSLEVDLVLVGIGLHCNSECVASLKLNLGRRGGIPVDAHMETPVKGVYAIGDVIDRTWLAHGASAEALVAAENAMGARKKMDYRVLPRCAFTTPEVAAVGMTEAEAQAQGIQTRCGKFLYSGLGRAHAMNAAEGMVKVVGDAKTDELLGLHILGHSAGELIGVGAVAMKLEATIHELADTVFTHPTLGEGIKEAAEDYFGHSIHTPAKKK